MKFSKTLAAGLSALGLLAGASSSFAVPSLNFTDSGATSHTVDPFGGFDWASNGTAVATAPTYVFDGTNWVSGVTTTFMAIADVIRNPGGTGVTPAGINSTYQFTVKATILETSTCFLWFGAAGASACRYAEFTATGGAFDIYFDTDIDADMVSGLGFTDGLKVLSGSILPGFAGSFTASSPTAGLGSFAFDAAVTFTETDSTQDAYFNPALDTSNATSTLQIGGTQTNWLAPNEPNWGDGGTIGASDIVFQADGNQTFTAAVPEPASLALVGLSLLGLAATRRRRAK